MFRPNHLLLNAYWPGGEFLKPKQTLELQKKKSHIRGKKGAAVDGKRCQNSSLKNFGHEINRNWRWGDGKTQYYYLKVKEIEGAKQLLTAVTFYLMTEKHTPIQIN